MTVEKDVVMTLRAKDGGIGLPFKELTKESTKATASVKRTDEALTSLTRSAVTGLGSEARKGFMSLRGEVTSLASEVNKLRVAFESTGASAKRMAAETKSASGGALSAMMNMSYANRGGTLAPMMHLGGSSATVDAKSLAGGSSFMKMAMGALAIHAMPGAVGDLTNVAALFHGGPSTTNMSKGFISPIVADLYGAGKELSRTLFGIAREMKQYERDIELHQLSVQNQQRYESVIALRRPFAEQQRGLRLMSGMTAAGPGLAQQDAARSMRDLALGDRQFAFGESFSRMAGAGSSARFGAGLQATLAEAQRASAAFDAQGPGSMASQRAISEAKTVRDQERQEMARLQREESRLRIQSIDLKAGAVIAGEDLKTAQRNSPSVWTSALFRGTGGKEALTGAETRNSIAQDLLRRNESDLAEVAAKRVEAGKRLIQAEQSYGAAIAANNAAERQRLTERRDSVREAGRAFRDIAFQEKERIQGAKENLGLESPLVQLQVLGLSRRAKAAREGGTRLLPQEIAMMRQHGDIFGDVLKDIGGRQGDQNPMIQEAFRNVGIDRKQREAEAGAAAMGKEEMTLAKKLEAVVTVDSTSLAKQLADTLTPLIAGLMAALETQLRAEMVKLQRDQAAGRRAINP